jgi:predicted acylesterase/phospholipase RssA
MAIKNNKIIDRLGLGLSGGGFRASFFHIGILAQMADQGLLRHVEVISTVSGGSIIGALYYLHVKKLLESIPDDRITDQHYIDIVKEIELDFLKATEKNIRMSTFTDFIANFKMVLFEYSRSDRIAKLYNEAFYQLVLSGVSDPIQMQELKIYPKGGSTNFYPLTDNNSRKAKVPILVLNATSLNSGRNWQFTAQTMGEPPVLGINKFDKKPIRLRRADGYGYGNMVNTPINQQQFSLGHAVAASACVPILFDPLAISNLYYNREDKESIRVQLVDGGVFDNQGTDGLLQYDCTCFVISDAAGQMGTENNPAVDAIPLALRVGSILQDRVRTESLLHLTATNTNNVAFISLREGLGIQQIGWFDKNNIQAPDILIPPSSQDFGVDPRVQDSLSKMRTDLDAFTEVEAYSLMLDAYLMSKMELDNYKKTVNCSDIQNSVSRFSNKDWAFLGIEKWMREPTEEYLKQLKVAQLTFGKALMLLPWLLIPLFFIAFVSLYVYWSQLVGLLFSSIPVYLIVIALLPLVINRIAPDLLKLLPFLEALRPTAMLAKAVGKVMLLTMGTVFVQLYLWIINPLFLKYGRLSNLK